MGRTSGAACPPHHLLNGGGGQPRERNALASGSTGSEHCPSAGLDHQCIFLPRPSSCFLFLCSFGTWDVGETGGGTSEPPGRPASCPVLRARHVTGEALATRCRIRSGKIKGTCTHSLNLEKNKTRSTSCGLLTILWDPKPNQSTENYKHVGREADTH